MREHQVRLRVRVKAVTRPHLTVVPHPSIKPAPDLDMVLSQFEAMTANGSLQSIAVAGIGRDGAMHTAFVHNGRAIELMGAVNNLLRRVSAVFPIA